MRDDFWVAASRFMQDLEVRLARRRQHARSSTSSTRCMPARCLAAFGRAYGRLPEGTVELSQEQEQFLDRAVEGLAQDGKIICVRLALFADMLKGKPWTTATLSQVGGTEGLGVTFLEETFSASTAPAAHRYHQQAAQAVLKALLPEAGSDIKGSRQSYEALLEASGYCAAAERVRRSDPDSRQRDPPDHAHGSGGRGCGCSCSGGLARASEDCWRNQLPSGESTTSSPTTIWSRRFATGSPASRRETRRGRAQLRLVERSAIWTAKPEHRHLPSCWEYLNIRVLTRGKDWTDSQRKMMHAAGRHYGLLASGILALLLFAGIALQQFVAHQQRRSVRRCRNHTAGEPRSGGARKHRQPQTAAQVDGQADIGGPVSNR